MAKQSDIFSCAMYCSVGEKPFIIDSIFVFIFKEHVVAVEGAVCLTMKI